FRSRQTRRTSRFVAFGSGGARCGGELGGRSPEGIGTRMLGYVLHTVLVEVVRAIKAIEAILTVGQSEQTKEEQPDEGLHRRNRWCDVVKKEDKRKNGDLRCVEPGSN